MLLNDMMFSTDDGDIYYKFKNGNMIKLGEYNFKPEHKSVKINITDIAQIEYEGDTGEKYISPNRYWFKSQYVCDLYHGFYCRDDRWVTENFKELSPFTEDVNNLLEKFFTVAFNRAVMLGNNA